MVFKDKKYKYETEDKREDGNGGKFVRETTKEELDHIKEEIYEELKTDLAKKSKVKDIAKKAGGGGASVLLITAMLRIFGLDPTVDSVQTAGTIIELSSEEKEKLFNGLLSEEELKFVRELIQVGQQIKEDLNRRDLSAIDVIRHTKDYSVMVWNKDTRKLNPIIEDIKKRTIDNETKIIALENKN